MKILAMDLGKSKSVVCEYDSGCGHHVFRTIRTRPEEVHDVLVEMEPDRVVIETGPVSGWVYDLVRSLEIDVQVANTNHPIWRWQVNPKKTDRADALKLAQLSSMGQLPMVHMPSKAVRQWRSLIEYRQALVEAGTAIKNRIRALLTREGILWKSGKKGWTEASLVALRELCAVEHGSSELLWPMQLSVELDVLAATEAALAKVTGKLNAMGQSQASVRHLQQVPGVGPRLAEAMVATLDTPHRFAGGKQVGRYVGLTPRQYQSGQQDRKGRISGQGNSTLRSLLVEVSWLMLRWNDWARATYRRLLQNCGGRKKVAIVALARKLLVRLWAMWRDGTAWRDELSVVR